MNYISPGTLPYTFHSGNFSTIFCLFTQHCKMFLQDPSISPIRTASESSANLQTCFSAALKALLHTFFQSIKLESWWSIFYSTFGLVQTHVLILILCTRQRFQELEQVLQVRRSSPPECCLVLLWLTALPCYLTLTLFPYDQSPSYVPILATGPHLCAWPANLTFVCVV